MKKKKKKTIIYYIFDEWFLWNLTRIILNLFLEDKFEQHTEKKKNSNTIITQVLESESFEVSSTSEEELTEVEEVSEENENDESEKEDGSIESSCEDYIEEEEEEEELQEIQHVVDDKIEPIQHNDTADLRTELKRRRALRLNMVD